MNQYSLLRLYLNGYLYQGYPEDYGDEWGALAELVHETPNEVSALRAEISALLRAPH